MNKINILFALLLIFQLTSNIICDDLLNILNNTLCRLLGICLQNLIKFLENILNGFPELIGIITPKELGETILLINDKLGIKITDQLLKTLLGEVININKLNEGRWIATLSYHYLLPDEYQKRLCGVIRPNNNNEENNNKINKREILLLKNINKRQIKQQQCTYKTEFDVRDIWPECNNFFNNVVNQGQCGSCWAISTAAAFTECRCIERLKNGENTEFNAENTFSALDVLSCSRSLGCKGGWPHEAFQWMKNNGICTGTDKTKGNGCKPYPFEPYKIVYTPTCSSYCTSGEYGKSYKDDKHYVGETDKLNGEEAIIEQLKSTGPVTVCFDVYSDFNGYKTGVYFKTAGAVKKGAHAVVIVGYGTQDCEGKEIKYWIIRNSWGKNWGEEGFVKFRRGENECRIEENGAYAIP